MKLSKQLYTLGFLLIFLLTFSLVHALGTTNTGHRVDKSTVAEIDEWGECRNVDNNSTNDYFVPTKTAQEWSNFRAVADTNSLPGISTSACKTCDDVNIGGQIICLEEGAATQSVCSTKIVAHARYLNGKIQTRVVNGWIGPDSGWVDGTYAYAAANNYFGYYEQTALTTANGVKLIVTMTDTPNACNTGYSPWPSP